MSNTTTTISALSLLDQQIRRDIFRPLQSDPEGAANLALAYPVYTNKIGTATFRAYRASRPHHLRYFLSDLVACPPLARFVEAICLAAPLDDQAQSGSWELMFALVQQQPQSLPLIFPAGVPAAASLSDFFAKYQLTLVNGAVRGLEHVPLAFYYGLVLSQVLPRMCRNVEVVEMPRAWGGRSRVWLLQNFANIRYVRMV